MRNREAPCGPGTPYATYEEYWEAEVIEPLKKSYKELTGEEAFPTDIVQLCYDVVDKHGRLANDEGERVNALKSAIGSCEYSHENDPCATLVFVDKDKISIVRCIDNDAIAVRIYGDFSTAPEFGNPALIVSRSGEVVRFHGELWNAEKYLKGLL